MTQKPVKRFVILILVGIAFPFSVASQCLPDGIVFDTQDSIDNFQTNHPECTEIIGDVIIEGEDINNLSGLTVLTAFNGNVLIRNVDNLISLTGLENLSTVGGNLIFETLFGLMNISALGNLSSVGGSLHIYNCDALQSLTGLESLITIGNDFYFQWSYGPITDFENFTSLNSIGGAFIVEETNIVNFNGMESLSSIGGYLGVMSSENFQSFTGLSSLTTIGGGLGISYSPSIVNFEGLENIQSLGGDLSVYECNGFANFTGLESLTTIEGVLVMVLNPSLTDLSQLSSLTSLGIVIHIQLNNNLTSLTGIGNVDASTLTQIQISNNQLLSDCAVQSICDYLEDPSTVFIYDNASGCDSKYEVLDACETIGVDEVVSKPQLSTYPNPFTSSTTIEYQLTEPSHIQLTIYNHLGEVVEEAVSAYQLFGVHTYEWSAERLSEGMYFAVLRGGDGVSVVKLIKQ